jgi:hypothetical protein
MEERIDYVLLCFDIFKNCKIFDEKLDYCPWNLTVSKLYYIKKASHE